MSDGKERPPMRADTGSGEGQELYRTLANALPAFVWITRPDGSLEFLNDRWFEYTGAERAEDQYAVFTRCIPAEDLDRLLAGAREAARTAALHETPFRCRGQNGETRWFLARSIPMRDEAGRITRWLGLSTDITAQKEEEERQRALEEQLRISEMRFRTIVEQSPFSIQVLSPLGKTVMVNPAWELLWGLTLEQLEGYNMLEDQQLVEKGVMPYIRRAFAGEACAIPAIMYDPQATLPGLTPEEDPRRWVEAFIYPVKDEAGALQQVILVHQEVSERIRASEALRRQTEEITALNQRLQRAMQETHHRVRNNLQMIAAFVDMQAQETEDVVPVEELSRIGGQVRALAAVHDILTRQAKADEPNDISTREVLEELVQLICQTTPGRRIELEAENVQLPLRQGTSLVIVANEAITNAVKHSAGAVQVRFTVREGSGFLEVLDDGSGFPDGFDPLKSDSYGAALVSNVARWDLAGQASFANRPEGGGIVTVSLPLPELPDG